jgi:hypothetical protein
MLDPWRGRCGLKYQGAHYHVTSRGNERKAIFRDDTDREKFLELTGRSVEQLANNPTRTMAIDESPAVKFKNQE